MVPTELVCTQCEYTPSERTPYCPECGAEDSWSESPKHRFDNKDLPIVFSHEVYDDQYPLWRSFCQSYFGAMPDEEAISGLPDEFPQLDLLCVELWFGVTADFEVLGPCLTRGAVEEQL